MELPPAGTPERAAHVRKLRDDYLRGRLRGYCDELIEDAARQPLADRGRQLLDLVFG